MALRAIHRYRNPDTTTDLNARWRRFAVKGVFWGGEVQAVLGRLQVQVGLFGAVGNDGMMTVLEGTPAILDVAASTTQYVVGMFRYVANNLATTTLTVLTQTEYDNLSEPDLADAILFAKVTVPPAAVSVTAAMIDHRVADRVDPVGRGAFRGILAAVTDLPATVGGGSNRSGDHYFVLADGAFHYWTGSAWAMVNANDVDFDAHVATGSTDVRHVTDNMLAALEQPSSGTVLSRSNPVVDSAGRVARLEHVACTGLTGKYEIQLYGRYYVGDGVVATAKDYFFVAQATQLGDTNFTQRHAVQLLGSDGRPIPVLAVYTTGTPLVPPSAPPTPSVPGPGTLINPSSEPGGFVTNPRLRLNFENTTDIGLQVDAVTVLAYREASIGGVRATGRIHAVAPAGGGLDDGTYFVISDGAHPPVTFEFGTNGIHDVVDSSLIDIVGATTAEEVASRIASAINLASSSILAITAEVDDVDPTYVNLVNDVAGESGNVAIDSHVPGLFGVSGMDYGVDALDAAALAHPFIEYPGAAMVPVATGAFTRLSSGCDDVQAALDAIDANSAVDAADIENSRLLWANAHGGGVISGMAVTAGPGSTITMAAGTYVIGGKYHSVGTATYSTEWVSSQGYALYIDIVSGDVAIYTVGDPSPTVGYVGLALWVGAGAGVVTSLTDLRVFVVPAMQLAYSSGGPVASAAPVLQLDTQGRLIKTLVMIAPAAGTRGIDLRDIGNTRRGFVGLDSANSRSVLAGYGTYRAALQGGVTQFIEAAPTPDPPPVGEWTAFEVKSSANGVVSATGVNAPKAWDLAQTRSHVVQAGGVLWGRGGGAVPAAGTATAADPIVTDRYFVSGNKALVIPADSTTGNQRFALMTDGAYLASDGMKLDVSGASLVPDTLAENTELRLDLGVPSGVDVTGVQFVFDSAVSSGSVGVELFVRGADSLHVSGAIYLVPTGVARGWIDVTDMPGGYDSAFADFTISDCKVDGSITVKAFQITAGSLGGGNLRVTVAATATELVDNIITAVNTGGFTNIVAYRIGRTRVGIMHQVIVVNPLYNPNLAIGVYNEWMTAGGLSGGMHSSPILAHTFNSTTAWVGDFDPLTYFTPNNFNAVYASVRIASFSNGSGSVTFRGCYVDIEHRGNGHRRLAADPAAMPLLGMPDVA